MTCFGPSNKVNEVVVLLLRTIWEIAAEIFCNIARLGEEDQTYCDEATVIIHLDILRHAVDFAA